MALRASISLTNLQASTTAARVTAQTTYQLGTATGIWTDPDSKNRILRDEYLLSEVHFTLLEKNVSDSYTFSDSEQKHVGKGFTTDSVSFTETFINQIAYHRKFNDAFTLDDLSQIDKDFYGNKGNIFAFTDILGLTYEKNLTDSYTIGDVVELVMTWVRSFTDITTLSDDSFFNVYKNTTETIGLSEIQSKDVTKPTSDSYNLSDESTLHAQPNKTDSFAFTDIYSKSLAKYVVDAFTLDDSALIDKDFYGNKGNVLGVADIFARAVDYKRRFPGNLPLGSNLLNSNSLDASSTPDTRVIVEDKATVLSKKSFVETLGFSDYSNSTFSKVVNDAFTLDDLSQIDKDFYGNKGNVAFMTDIIGLDQTKVLTDSYTIGDVVAAAINKAAQDSFSFTDTSYSTFSKVVNDAFTLDDSALIDKDFYGNKGNAFSFADVLASAVNKVATDNFGFIDSEYFSYSKNSSDTVFFAETDYKNIEKALPDSFSFSDIQGVQLGKTISDSFALDDSALIDKDYFGNKGNIVGVSDQVAVEYFYGGLLGQRPLNRVRLN